MTFQQAPVFLVGCDWLTVEVLSDIAFHLITELDKHSSNGGHPVWSQRISATDHVMADVRVVRQASAASCHARQTSWRGPFRVSMQRPSSNRHILKYLIIVSPFTWPTFRRTWFIGRGSIVRHHSCYSLSKDYNMRWTSSHDSHRMQAMRYQADVHTAGEIEVRKFNMNAYWLKT